MSHDRKQQCVYRYREPWLRKLWGFVVVLAVLVVASIVAALYQTFVLLGRCLSWPFLSTQMRVELRSAAAKEKWQVT